MPWAGGVFTRIYNWINDEASAIDIEAARMDGEDDNFATGINACLTKDGSNYADKIELGHASDTTLTRSAAGVVAVEGVDLVDLTSSQTLTNKKVNSVYDTASITTLAAITGMSAADRARVKYRAASDDMGGGDFRWDSSDLSTEVTADAEEGIYVAPDSDATGASGAWVRVIDDVITPHMFGAVGDGSNDDITAIQAAIDYVTGLGGGIVQCLPGKSYDCIITTSITDNGLIVKDNVIFDLNGSELLINCTGAVYGVRLKNYSWIKNGTINVDTSSTPGSAGVWHSPVSIGPAYGEGGTVGSVSSFEGVKGWGVHNVRVASVRADAVGIQGYGACHHGYIGHVRADDSSTLAGVVGFDWGEVGGIDSNDIPASRTLFNAGTAYTTHPNNILIEEISAGALSRDSGEGSRCVRLSGVHDIEVRRVTCDETNYAGVFHTAGDCGYEFALAAIKPFRHKGITIDGVSIKNANDGWGVFCDCFADNVAAAVTGSGYSPLLDPIQETDIVFENVKTWSDGGASVLPGFRVQKQIGGTLKNCSAYGHKNGVLVEEACDSLRIIDGYYDDNREDGIYAGHGSDLPEDLTIEQAHTGGNGTDTGYSNPAGINLQGVTRAKIINNELSHDTETTQYRGLTVSTTCTGVTVRDNHCEDLDTGGQAYVIASSTTYTTLDVFNNNTVGTGVPNYIAGANIIPYSASISPNGTKIRRFTALKASLSGSTTPSAGAWIAGDTIDYADPSASDYKGTVCVTGGSPGTWKRYGATTA